MSGRRYYKQPSPAIRRQKEPTYLRVEFSDSLQLQGHLNIRRYSEEQGLTLDYSSERESAIETVDIMPSSIPFKYDFKADKLKTIKTKKKTTVGNDTETTEVEIPIIGSSCTKFQLIYCTNKFRKGATTMGWTTGPRLFLKFKEILESERDVELWDQHYTSEGMTETVANFWNLVRIFIRLKFENNMDAYDNHKDYLLAVTKEKEMTVTDFESQVRYHNHSVLPWLPGAPAVRLDAMLSERDF